MVKGEVYYANTWLKMFGSSTTTRRIPLVWASRCASCLAVRTLILVLVSTLPVPTLTKLSPIYLPQSSRNTTKSKLTQVMWATWTTSNLTVHLSQMKTRKWLKALVLESVETLLSSPSDLVWQEIKEMKLRNLSHQLFQPSLATWKALTMHFHQWLLNNRSSWLPITSCLKRETDSWRHAASIVTGPKVEEFTTTMKRLSSSGSMKRTSSELLVCSKVRILVLFSVD